MLNAAAQDGTKGRFTRLVRDTRGQGAVEHIVLIAIVGISLIGIMVMFRGSVGDIPSAISRALESSGAPAATYAGGTGGGGSPRAGGGGGSHSPPSGSVPAPGTTPSADDSQQPSEEEEEEEQQEQNEGQNQQ
jgi:Flp pilus assembly pilin Flp